MILLTSAVIVLFYTVYSIGSSLSSLTSGKNISILIALTFYSIALSVILIFVFFFFFYSHVEKRLGRIENLAVIDPITRAEIENPTNPGLITRSKAFFNRQKKFENRPTVTHTVMQTDIPIPSKTPIKITRVNIDPRSFPGKTCEQDTGKKL